MNIRHMLVAFAGMALAACASQPSTPMNAPAATLAPPAPTVAATVPAASVAPPATAYKAMKANAVRPQTPAAPARLAVSARAHHLKVHHERRMRPRIHRVAEHHHAAPRAVAAHQLAGKLQLVAGHGQTVHASDYRHTVVYFVPKRGDDRPRPSHATIYTHHRDFDPDWLAVPQGSTVTFTNLDQVTHNVFSVTPGSSFDLGYEDSQDSVSHRFEHPGMVLISCHVHRYMRGNILVIPSRYATRVRADGKFRLKDLPPVAGTLYFWNPRTAPAVRSVTPPFGRLRQRLVINQSAVKTQIDLGPGS